MKKSKIEAAKCFESVAWSNPHVQRSSNTMTGDRTLGGLTSSLSRRSMNRVTLAMTHGAAGSRQSSSSGTLDIFRGGIAENEVVQTLVGW